MAKLSKRAKAIREKLEAGKFYSVEEALELLKSMPPLKFEPGRGSAKIRSTSARFHRVA